jgi:PAS domain S-box-containing protein
MTNIRDRRSSDVPLTPEHAHDGVRGLRATIDLAPIGIAQLDVEGRFLLVNDRLCHIFGCDRGDLLNRRFHELTFPDDLPHCLELTRQLVADEIPDYTVDKRFVRFDGSVVWAHITVSAVRDSGGSVAFLIGTAEDITKEVEARAELRIAEERLRTALDASGIGTFRFNLRTNALEWADGFERVFGTADRVGLDQFFEIIHPDDRTQVMTSYRRSVTEGVDFEEEFRVVWPDGSIHWLHDRGRTIRGADGLPECIVGAITDITNHKRMEEVIQEREAQFRTLANTIPQLAWIANNDGSRTWCNDRWLDYTGVEPQKMLGFGWMHLHASEQSAAEVLAAQRAAFQAGSVWEGLIQLRRKDGEYRWFLSRAMPVRGVDGSILQWFGTNTDITERLESEQQLRESLRREQAARAQAERAIAARQQVLGFVAHDLRSPLQAIFLNTNRLAELPADERAGRLDLIVRSAREMNRLIADLLDVSRIEAGQFSVRHEPLAIAPLLSSVVEQFEEQARTREVQLMLDVDPDLPLVEGDTQRLAQALSNLVSNAIKFTPAGGRIVLGAHPAPTHLDLIVQDSGCGIAPESLNSIFDRFWQANRTSGGAGLGLAIAKGIIDAHGGGIRVESSCNEGTTFHVTLPYSGSALSDEPK